jgi:hypothetical protein
VFILVLIDPFLSQLNPVDTSLLCLCIWGEDTSITNVGTVVVYALWLTYSPGVGSPSEAFPLSCHNRKVSGYIAAYPVIIEGGDFVKELR